MRDNVFTVLSLNTPVNTVKIAKERADHTVSPCTIRYIGILENHYPSTNADKYTSNQ